MEEGEYKVLGCSHTTHPLPDPSYFPGSWYPGKRIDVVKSSWFLTLIYYEQRAVIQPTDLHKSYQPANLHFSILLSNTHTSPSCPVENPMKQEKNPGFFLEFTVINNLSCLSSWGLQGIWKGHSLHVLSSSGDFCIPSIKCHWSPVPSSIISCSLCSPGLLPQGSVRNCSVWAPSHMAMH